MNKYTTSKVINIIFYIFLIIILLGFILNNKKEFIINLVVIFIFYIILTFIERKKIPPIPNYIRILMILTILLHLILGQYFSLYYNNKFFDNILHIIGTFSFSLFFYYISTVIFNDLSKSKFFTFIFISLLGISASTLFEIMEFFLDIIFDANNQHSLKDTNLDIIYNIVGSLISGFFMAKKNRV